VVRSLARLPWWLPYAGGALLAAAALAVMVWQVVIRGPFLAADWPVHEFLTPRVPDGAGKVALDTLARPGQRWLTLPLLLAAGAWVSWRQHRLRPLLAVLTGLGSAYLVGRLVKDGLARTPPYRDIDILHGLGEAFPSGHAANAAMTWALLSVLLLGSRGLWPNPRRLRAALLASAAVAVVVGTIMVVMDYHWVSDIVGGWTVGLFALMLALLALGPPATQSGDEPSAARSGDDQRRGDRREALPAAGETEPVGRRAADRDRAAEGLGEDRLGLGPP
jgi:membrane-associated phospholipid phosphatase